MDCTLSPTLNLHTKVVQSKGPISARLGNEQAILHPESGKYYGLNEVGALIWNAVAEPATLSQVRDLIVKEYDVTEADCVRDLTTLLETLHQNGLVQIHA